VSTDSHTSGDHGTSTEPNFAVQWRDIHSLIPGEGFFALTPESQPATPPQANEVEGRDHPSPQLDMAEWVVSSPETTFSKDSGVNSLIAGGEETGNTSPRSA